MMPDNNLQGLAINVSKMLEAGRTSEDVLKFLREAGCHKIDSIKILRRVLNISLGEAKQMVHFSSVWSDVRERDDAFHSSLEELNRRLEQ
jgi:ribosomal protein L7/L12